MLPPSVYAPSIAHFLFNMVRAFSGPTPYRYIRVLRITAAASLVAIVLIFASTKLNAPADSLAFYYIACALAFWLSVGMIIYHQRVTTAP